MKDLLGHLRDLYVVQHTVEPPASIGSEPGAPGPLRSQANRVPTALTRGFIDLIWATPSGRCGRGPTRGWSSKWRCIKLTRPETDTSLRSRCWPVSTAWRRPSTATRRACVLGLGRRVRAPGRWPGGSPAARPTRRLPSPVRPQAAPTPTLRSVPAPAADDRGAPTQHDEPPWAAAPTDDAGAEAAPRRRRHGSRPDRATLDNLKRAWPVILNAVKRARPARCTPS